MKLDIPDFARIFGVSEETLGKRVRSAIQKHDFSFQPLEGEERDKVILQIFKKLNEEMSVSGPHRYQRWEDGWAENLEAFQNSGRDFTALIPNYYKSGNNHVLRLEGRYIRPASVTFEVDFLEVLREWIAEKYFQPFDHIYEIGCGPAHNLVAFADAFPDKHYVGVDWAKSSQEIIKLIAQQGLNISGARMDIFHPDENFHIEPNSALITFGCLEQVGEKFQPFLDYLLNQKPGLCIHVEPVVELYDEETLFDHLGAEYSRKRGYLNGYLEALRALEKSGKIEILHVKKTLGSQYHDGWSIVVWRVKG